MHPKYPKVGDQGKLPSSRLPLHSQPSRGVSKSGSGELSPVLCFRIYYAYNSTCTEVSHTCTANVYHLQTAPMSRDFLHQVENY